MYNVFRNVRHCHLSLSFGVFPPRCLLFSDSNSRNIHGISAVVYIHLLAENCYCITRCANNELVSLVTMEMLPKNNMCITRGLDTEHKALHCVHPVGNLVKDVVVLRLK